MKKISLVVLIALTFALVTNLTIARAGSSSDAEVSCVGYVIAYTPNENITIVDKDGSQFTFTLAPGLKILPPPRANLLKVGSFVTVISPSNVSSLANPGTVGVATGIVVHPQVPPGFPIPTFTATPLPSATSTITETPTAVMSETSTLPETATATTTVIDTATSTATETATPTNTGEVPSETPTATVTATGTVTTTTSLPQASQSFVDWLASLFRQVLTMNR